jgi:hypothetical protein
MPMAPNEYRDTNITGTLAVAGAITLNGVAVGAAAAAEGLNALANLAGLGVGATPSGVIGTSEWLKVEAQASPNLTVKISKGAFYLAGVLGGITSDTASLSGFAAPATNPRIDIVQISTAGVISRKAGTENASPTAPTADANNLKLAEVYNRVGQTSVKNSDDASNGYITNTAAHL